MLIFEGGMCWLWFGLVFHVKEVVVMCQIPPWSHFVHDVSKDPSILLFVQGRGW